MHPVSVGATPLGVIGISADIARRQFVPTNCAQLPSSDYRGDKTVITPFSSVSIQELRDNESSIMINFQGSLYEQI